jgi:hypothetical protein
MTGRSLAPTTLIFKMHGISSRGGGNSGRVIGEGSKRKLRKRKEIICERGRMLITCRQPSYPFLK